MAPSIFHKKSLSFRRNKKLSKDKPMTRGLPIIEGPEHSESPNTVISPGEADAQRKASVPEEDSAHSPSLFDQIDEVPEHHTNQTSMMEPTAEEEAEKAYDLEAPAPTVSPGNMELVSGRFFSADHLEVILKDPTTAARFTRFLHQHRPDHAPVLARHLEGKKASYAIEYANSLMANVPFPARETSYTAATPADRFKTMTESTLNELTEEALPAYLTQRLVSVVTDVLVKEITGNLAPMMADMVPSLAEVYCLTDPSIEDNPIIYASEEFYNTTQYGREYVIGRNCRFLQGPETKDSTVRRLVEMINAGHETCETILNYRRDGTPFLNLLMMAPLHDNKGKIRYFLGCQIDVSPLVEDGRGLESFQQLMMHDHSEKEKTEDAERGPKNVLSDLSQMFTDDEAKAMEDRDNESISEQSMISHSRRPKPKKSRRVLGMDDMTAEQAMWAHPSLGRSGRLPGVYRSYILVRPFPSLRVTFTSPSMRIPGLLQTKFTDRIGGPSHICEGISEAMQDGIGVTAKVSWLTSPSANGSSSAGEVAMEGKPRWIHCTPLFGSDEQVGVWMVVMIEHEEATNVINRQYMESNAKVLASLGMSGSGAGGSQRYESARLPNQFASSERGSTESSRRGGPMSTTQRSEAGSRSRDF